ncbi:MAG: class I SAM-dependent methyltransferase [Ktedonobacteraceae bacterium]|nr:class I SAM-dependent methyltransferase [Ktedonobacteraceae bacterium]
MPLERTLPIHQVMLSDRRRLEQYKAALQAAVQSHHVIADVGCGTGILALFAASAGVRKVYAIDVDPDIVQIAYQIVLANGMADKITVVHADATDLRLREPVDGIVTEMMGNFGPEEQMESTLRGFISQNLKPGGYVIPESVETFLHAVEYQDEFTGVWEKNFMGMDLSCVSSKVRSSAALYFFVHPPKLLAPPIRVSLALFGEEVRTEEIRNMTSIPVMEAGVLHGFVGSFRAKLSQGVVLSNFPSYPGCNWATWNWPVSRTPVQRGDSLSIELNSHGNHPDVTTWHLHWLHIARQEATS